MRTFIYMLLIYIIINLVFFENIFLFKITRFINPLIKVKNIQYLSTKCIFNTEKKYQ
jgi:hypothetical protein